VRALNEYQPAVIGSYPTALAVLAGEQAAGRLRIRPALALSGAERLSPAAAERIKTSFHCPLHDTYAASEFMGIAFDCRYGRLHLNTDWVILEPVDAALRPVPPGTPSHSTLLTNLANRVQPIIRYDLGDSITMLPSRCPCGSPLPLVRPEGGVTRFCISNRRVEGKNRFFPGAGHGSGRDGGSPELPGDPGRGESSSRTRRRGSRIRSHAGLRGPSPPSPGYLSSVNLESVVVELTVESRVRDPSGGKLRQFYAER